MISFKKYVQSSTWVLVNYMHTYLDHESFLITLFNVYKMSPEIQFLKYELQEYRNTIKRYRKIQVIEI